METDDLYHHSGSADGNSSDGSTDGNDQESNSMYKHHQYGGFYSNSPQGARGRFNFSTSSEEDVIEPSVKTVDPGPFRYNKRVFITALPCLLLTLVMTGEMLVFMVSVGGLVIVLMTHMGEDVGKRCVVMFVLLFIPCHILIIGTVLPLLWLSLWNILLVGIVNVFCILTGGWIILQFHAFRKEESSLCSTIEQLLFAAYPCVCCALVTWVLSAVVSVPTIPFIFVFLWFVYLQLYLIPAESSFKRTQTTDEDLSVLQQPIIFCKIAAFTVSGPFVHVMLVLTGTSASAILSVHSLILLPLLLCLDLFLSTMLSLRQLFDYMGWPHLWIVHIRWASGIGVVLLAYPALKQLGMTSHFLIYLPVAAAGFGALGLILNFRKGKTLSLLLMALLMVLLCMWLFHLPWTLIYDFLGSIPLRAFYMLVASNFMLCVMAIFAVWHSSKEVFGFLLVLQSICFTVCEMGLYQAKLYSLPAFHLTGIISAYMVYRLYVGQKLTHNMATVASAVQLTKMVVSVLAYLMRERVGRRESVASVIEITVDFVTQLFFVWTLVRLFVYETTEVVTQQEIKKHLSWLLRSMAISARSFLLPVTHLIFQEDPTLADILGCLCGLGGALVLLYALQHSQSPGVLDQLMKVAIVIGGVGALVIITQPRFDLTLFALYQWSEVLSIMLIAALLVTGMETELSHILALAGVLGLCPGIHATMLLYGEDVTLLHFILMIVISSALLAFVIVVIKVKEVSETTENFFKTGSVVLAVLLVTVFAVDVINLQRRDSVWNYPVWRIALGVMACISSSLKALVIKLGPGHLPLTKGEKHGVPLIPVIGNLSTVAAFLLACTQGPQDALLHDLWCCASSVFLVMLQRDALLLSSLSPSNRAMPTVMAAVGALIVSTLAQSRLWRFDGMACIIFGFLEVLSVLASLPLYIVLAGIMWDEQIWSEKGVVFTLPMNAFVFLLGSSYTAWALCVAGLVCGFGMMGLKLPLQPYNAYESLR